MTRYDKYGMKCYVEKYCCGSCAHYEFEDDDDKNLCRQFWNNYYKDDSCDNHWDEASECGY